MNKPSVIVVGSGAGGGFAAMELALNGFNVTLLERGKRYTPKDYAMNQANWEMAVNPLKNANAVLFDEDFARPLIEAHDSDISSYTISGNQSAINKPQDSGQTRQRGRFVYHRVLGVGGSTLHYQGEAHRFAEHAFQSKTLYGWGQDWPVSYQDLEPYYDKAEKLLGVAGDHSVNPFKPKRGAFPTPAHALSKKSQLAAIGAEKCGWQLLPNTLALPSVNYDGRSACQHSGGCVQGCIFGAKSSVDLTAVEKGLQSGNLTLMTQAKVIRVNTDKDTVTGVEYLHEGELKTLNADIVILAAGAVETPRLLLHSASEYFPQGIGNQHDQLGRYFMETIFALIDCQSDIPIDSYQGPPLDSRIWEFYQPQKPLKTGFVMGVAGTLSARLGPKTYNESIRGFGLNHLKTMVSEFGNDIQFYAVAEQIPHENNRIVLSGKKDNDGMPLVQAHINYSAEDKNTLRFMLQKLHQWADATPGIRKKSVFSSYSQPSATHVAGTCRMGEYPETSVTDQWGMVHGTRNLYITDGSVMPTQGAGDSPSLTIQALALRTASAIGEQYKLKT